MVSRSPPKGLQSTPRTCGCRGNTTQCGDRESAVRACITHRKGAGRETHRSGRPVEIPGNAQGARSPLLYPPVTLQRLLTVMQERGDNSRRQDRGLGHGQSRTDSAAKRSKEAFEQTARMLVQRRGVLHTELQTVAPGDQQPGAATQAANVLFRLEHQAGGPPVGLYIPGAGR